MRRRQAMKGLAMITVGAGFVMACRTSSKDTVYTNLAIDTGEEADIRAICDAILPLVKSDAIPQLDSASFALMSVNDCFSPEEQQKYVQGFRKYKKMSSKANLSNLTAEEHLTLFKEASKEDGDEDLRFFASQTRNLVIRNFTVSQTYMEQYRAYKMLPGTYVACKQIS